MFLMTKIRLRVDYIQIKVTIHTSKTSQSSSYRLNTQRQRVYMKCETHIYLSLIPLTLNSTLLEYRPLLFRQEWINSHPNQREDGSKKNRPKHNNGRCPVLPPHQPLKEGIKMNNDPKCKKELPKQWPP